MAMADVATRMGIVLPVDWPPLPNFAGTIAGDVRDPYPDLARRRRETPVEARYRSSLGDAAAESERALPDSYWVYRYETVNTVMRDNALFSNEAIKDTMGTVMGPSVMIGLDDPEHRRHRNLVAQAFRLKTLGMWEADRVLPVIDDMIDRFVDRGIAELVSEFTYRVPVQVIASILGLPSADLPRFHLLAMQLLNVATDPMTGIRASQELADYFADLCDERRRDPRADVISDLVHAELDGHRLDADELLSFLRLLLPAGAETTFRSTGNLLFGLLTHPDQLDAVRADPMLMPAAVEEAVRWEPPLLIEARTAIVDVELDGVAIPAGSTITASLGAANHDESRWGETSEEFDIHRPPLPHISFGAGVHMCLGIHLARMEMRCMTGRLLERLPNLRLEPELAAELDSHIHGELFRSPTSLPVRWDRA